MIVEWAGFVVELGTNWDNGEDADDDDACILAR